MAIYEITLKDRTVEVVDEANAYQQEGQMTTFFATRDDRHVVDCWSERVANFRTSELVIIRRLSSASLDRRNSIDGIGDIDGIDGLHHDVAFAQIESDTLLRSA